MARSPPGTRKLEDSSLWEVQSSASQTGTSGPRRPAGSQGVHERESSLPHAVLLRNTADIPPLLGCQANGAGTPTQGKLRHRGRQALLTLHTTQCPGGTLRSRRNLPLCPHAYQEREAQRGAINWEVPHCLWLPERQLTPCSGWPQAGLATHSLPAPAVLSP